jgi:hypothetical protein
MLLRALQVGTLVAACARQVLLRIVQLVLVERQLGVRQFQLVRGAGVLRCPRFLGELRNALPAGGYARLEAGDMRRQVMQRTTGRRRDRDPVVGQFGCCMACGAGNSARSRLSAGPGRLTKAAAARIGRPTKAN